MFSTLKRFVAASVVTDRQTHRTTTRFDVMIIVKGGRVW